MRVDELTGEHLDYWVARANGWTFGPPHKIHEWDVWRDSTGEIVGTIPAQGYEPSKNWAQGGPIIDRERIATSPCESEKNEPIGWVAFLDGVEQYGTTALEAAMRAYVASKFGDEVQEGSESNG